MDRQVARAELFGDRLHRADGLREAPDDEEDDQAGHEKRQRRDHQQDVGESPDHSGDDRPRKEDAEVEVPVRRREKHLAFLALVRVCLAARLPGDDMLRDGPETLGVFLVARQVPCQDVFLHAVSGDHAALEKHDAAAFSEDLEIDHVFVQCGRVHVSGQNAEQFARVVEDGRGGRDDDLFGVLVDVGVREDDLSFSGGDGLLVPRADPGVVVVGFLPSPAVGELAVRFEPHVQVGDAAFRSPLDERGEQLLDAVFIRDSKVEPRVAHRIRRRRDDALDLVELRTDGVGRAADDFQAGFFDLIEHHCAAPIVGDPRHRRNHRKDDNCHSYELVPDCHFSQSSFRRMAVFSSLASLSTLSTTPQTTCSPSRTGRVSIRNRFLSRLPPLSKKTE